MSSVDIQRQCSSRCSKTVLQKPRFSLSNYFRTAATFLKESTVDVKFLLCPVVLERRDEYSMQLSEAEWTEQKCEPCLNKAQK